MYGIQKDGDIQQIAGNSHIVADDALSTTSENPIQNKVVTNALADVVTAANEAETSTTTPRDADLLGGHAPSYFATNDSLNALSNMQSLGDCAGNDTTLNNLITNAFNSMTIGTYKVFEVSDNTGTAIFGGGIMVVTIYKVSSKFASVFALRYKSSGIKMYVGSVYNSAFTGFVEK